MAALTIVYGFYNICFIRENRSEENTGRLKPLFRRPLHRIGQIAFNQQDRTDSCRNRTIPNHAVSFYLPPKYFVLL
ncbi:hypothetical protein HMPREF3156_01890 [Neisseria sp. HMSC06F02]|nr:hypothetical protein HMPREF3156_01890 [Neisseria sp. HMSC06F02]